MLPQRENPPRGRAATAGTPGGRAGLQLSVRRRMQSSIYNTIIESFVCLHLQTCLCPALSTGEELQKAM